MSAININHDTETITTENDTILNIGAKGGIKLGDGTNVNPVGNKGVLRFDTVNDKLQVSNGVDWQDAALLITEVDTDNIADGAVTNEKIANGEITEDKLEPSFVSDILRSSNNLSEIIDKGLARDNLGISTSTIHDVFTDGVDFTAGSASQDLTLSVAPKQLINCMVFFDAVYQAPETMTLNGNIITVDVPAGVSKIYVTYSENYIKTIGIPDDGFINTYTNKSTLTGNDELVLGNSEDGNKNYKTKISDLRADIGSNWIANAPAGTVIGYAYASITSNVTTTSASFSDAITLNYTPKLSNSLLIVEATAAFSSGGYDYGVSETDCNVGSRFRITKDDVRITSYQVTITGRSAATGLASVESPVVMKSIQVSGNTTQRTYAVKIGARTEGHTCTIAANSEYPAILSVTEVKQ